MPNIQSDAVNEYIAQFAPDQQDVLQKIRGIIRDNAPEALEKISYGMPTYHQKENLVHFAMHKNHIGFYPTPDGIDAFQENLTDYKTSKGAVQFPLDKPIPYDLIAEMVRYRIHSVCK